MNGFLVPANAKKGSLIFNIFRWIDLIIFGIGVGLSMILLLVLPSENVMAMCIAVCPVCITGILVFPIPNYHNVLCVLQSINRFYTERRKYVWKGWCFYEQFKDESKSKK